MLGYIKISLGIFIALAASRLIPHPPNFTSLIALSFYVPALLGKGYIPAVILSFAITDLFIGYHTGTHWTWGSVLIIGLISRYLSSSIFLRMGGALFGAFVSAMPFTSEQLFIGASETFVFRFVESLKKEEITKAVDMH